MHGSQMFSSGRDKDGQRVNAAKQAQDTGQRDRAGRKCRDTSAETRYLEAPCWEICVSMSMLKADAIAGEVEVAMMRRRVDDGR